MVCSIMVKLVYFQEYTKFQNEGGQSLLWASNTYLG